MKAGLLGAIGGLGQAMQTMGSSIIERREKALAEAKAMAKYERERADKKTDTMETRDYEISKLGALEDRRDARQAATISAADARVDKANQFKVTDREDRQEFASAQSAASREAAKDRVLLSAQLAEQRRAASASDRVAIVKLQEKLKGNDVRGVTYGAPDARGMSPVFAISRDGKLIDTRQKVRRPGKQEDDRTEQPL